MDSENYYVREVQCVEMADKENYTVAVHKAKKDYEFKTILEYKNNDGSRGWIIQIKEKK